MPFFRRTSEKKKKKRGRAGAWSKEEQFRFLKAIQVFGERWELVQYAVRTRPLNQVIQHHNSHEQRKKSKTKKKRSVQDITIETLE